MFGIELAGGAWIFLAVILIWTVSIIYSLYTRTGSGINQRPWGEEGYSSLSHDETTTSLWRRRPTVGVRTRTATSSTRSTTLVIIS